MANTAYELLVLASRYWFVALAALILARLAVGALQDLRDQPRGTGETIGHLVWLRRDAKTGDTRIEWLPLPPEAVIGSGRSCDVRVQAESVWKEHAHVASADGVLRIRALGDAPLRVAGRWYAHDALELHDGQTIMLGDVALVFKRGGSA